MQPVETLTVVFIEGGVNSVNISIIQHIGCQLKSFAKTLKMNDFPFPQETDDVDHIRIVCHAQDIVVGHARLLFRTHVFGEVCEDISLYSKTCGVIWPSAGSLRVYASCVIHEIGVKACFFYLLNRHVSCQLMNDGANHLQVAEFLDRNVGQNSF